MTSQEGIVIAGVVSSSRVESGTPIAPNRRSISRCRDSRSRKGSHLANIVTSLTSSEVKVRATGTRRAAPFAYNPYIPAQDCRARVRRVSVGLRDRQSECYARRAPGREGRQLRLALVQTNPTVGDIDGNATRIAAAAAAAEQDGATFILFPELAITGYPPEDLLLRERFVKDNLDALERIAAASRHSTVVGFVDRDGEKLYNAAALCGNGRVLRVYRKRRLPNYGVFDEERWFQPGDDPGLVEFGGEMYALTVCEDVWAPELPAELSGLGARVILNISASPFHAGKGAERESMLCGRALDNGVWVAYCNLVGGQDELVFDGRSCLISPDGEVVARASGFAEETLFADFSADGRLGAGERIEPLTTGEEEIWSALVTGLRDYVRKNGFRRVVLGLSGGIDSALTAALAADALGPENVTGVLMPSRHSSEGAVTDARELVANLGIEALEIPIEGPHAAFEEVLAPAFAGTGVDVTEENLQARVRGTLLMALSNKFGWLVLATGNKSELSVGYSTLYGDMVGGFAPIKDVFKTRVYDLARWRNGRGPAVPEATMTKPPSAELRPDQTDADSLPPYEQLDPVLRAYVEEDASRDEVAARGFAPDLVSRICGMVDAAEYKRRQGPLGIRVTPKAFGRDRRMPVTNAYRG
ncbi:MAG: NAD+ synthase [Coriobacteriaceae bacterium]|nr:NAD+ synthase [Coriobacteriaceae bacterium]